MNLESRITSICGFKLQVFQQLDKSYVTSVAQVAEVAGVDTERVLRFLESEFALKLLIKHNTEKADTASLMPDHLVPIEAATAFWVVEGLKGNIKAEGMVYACTQEVVLRRCDKAFYD